MRKNFKRLVKAVTMVSVLSGSTAYANTPELIMQLRGYETKLTPASLEGLSANPIADLSALMNDPSVGVTVRRRAVLALSQFDTAYDVVVSATQSGFPEVRRAAAAGLSHRFLNRGTADNRIQVLAVLQPLLNDGDMDVRATTVRSLGQLNLAEARTALSAQMRIESAAFIKNAIAVQLNR